MRLAKAIAHSGLASRREAERWIEAGRVAVDGDVIKSPATNVTSEQTITVDGKPIPEADSPRIWLFHKPKGCLTTSHDPEGRPTIYDHLPKNMKNLLSIGRLDMNTEGLLLLTNNGEVKRELELPANGYVRTYRVRVLGDISQTKLDSLNAGVTIDGEHFRPAKAVLDTKQSTGKNSWLTITVVEGKYHEIKRLMEHLGLTVTRLIRTAYGPYALGKLLERQVREASWERKG